MDPLYYGIALVVSVLAAGYLITRWRVPASHPARSEILLRIRTWCWIIAFFLPILLGLSLASTSSDAFSWLPEVFVEAAVETFHSLRRFQRFGSTFSLLAPADGSAGGSSATARRSPLPAAI